jgi:hypothetical protein
VAAEHTPAGTVRLRCLRSFDGQTLKFER